MRNLAGLEEEVTICHNFEEITLLPFYTLLEHKFTSQFSCSGNTTDIVLKPIITSCETFRFMNKYEKAAT